MEPTLTPKPGTVLTSSILEPCCSPSGIAASAWLADLVYNIPANIIVDSVRRALTDYDVLTSMAKSWVFGTIVSAVGVQTGDGIVVLNERIHLIPPGNGVCMH